MPPPKRNIKSSSLKSKPIPVPQPASSTNSESPEVELKFDQEVLWCISQFEKILTEGKLPEAKSKIKIVSPSYHVNCEFLILEQESIKAISTLRKPNIQKIQKVQLMKSYFKDYKAKMKKDEETVKSQATVNFEVCAANDVNNGVFVKRKLESSKDTAENKPAVFLFNFKDPSEEKLTHVNAKLGSLEL